MLRTGLAILLLLPGATPPAQDAADFDRTLAPLLAQRCLSCHSGPKPKGKLDLSRKASAQRVLSPGDLAKSRLWELVDTDEMPPKKPLKAEERAVLKAWIQNGAPWGSDPIDPFRLTTAERAGYDWWALRPVARPAGSIDAFILRGLREAGLEPGPEADRRTLIRRLSFDLLGLPPEPDEVRAFLDDRADGAWERLVDRFLASPHYGERWARHWLDVVRFGESNGFERDLPRDQAWPYRDWVIRALNADLPYDEFVRLQLAGDHLRPGDADATIATGYLVAGPHDTVIPASDRMRMTMQQDELEDVVGNAGQTFLGLTVNCARCHDHKFDPIPQADYYRMAAALAGATHGEREIRPARLAAIAAEVAEIERPAREAPRSKREAPAPFARWDFRRGLDGLTAHGPAMAGPEGLVLDGKSAWVETPPLDRDLGEKTLEAWVRPANLDQRGGGVLSVQTLDGSVFDAIVLGEREAGRWMAGSDFFKRTQSFQAHAEPGGASVHVAIVYRADGTVEGYRNGRAYGRPYKSEGLQKFSAGRASVVFGLRHGPPGGNKMFAGTIERAQLHDRALSAAEVAASAGVVEPADDEIVAALDEASRVRRAALLKEREGLAVRKVYAAVPADPGVMRVLRRGDVSDPGDAVPPAGLSALPGAHLGLPPNAPDAERRVRLARWIASAENPLFARVAVNRVWHHHFGRGLVDTPSDFGFNGGRPSHPELLDFLAAEFVRRGWSLKALHRLIVTSAAYRRTSAPRREAIAKDAGNRRLWRFSPQRLDAESLRDAMLRISGDLDATVGGKGYRDVRSHFFKGTQFYDPLEEGDGPLRRTIYRFGARGGRNPLLETFDCPDPSTATPQRPSTTTPLQALALLNNAFVLRRADRLAGRAKDVEGVYSLAFGRAPEARERERAEAFVRAHGLAAFCRVILNSSEFAYVE
jgi:hypothetical protein